MRCLVALAVLACTILVVPQSAIAEETTQQRVGPPVRPLPLSTAQYDALEELASQPENAQLADARASYSPEAARVMTEISVAATQIAIPASILTVLIAAAPL